MNTNLEIELLLDDMNKYIHSILLYLNNPNSSLKEMIMYLPSVNEIITNIKKYY